MKTQLRMSMLIAGIFLLLSGSNVRADVEIYPGDSNIFNVKAAPYNAKGDGIDDDTDEIQAAINAILALKRAPSIPQSAGNHTLYFPDGTYKVSRPLTFGNEVKPPISQSGTVIPLAMMIHVKGQSRDQTIIKLADGQFTDIANPKIIFSFHDIGASNNSFGNTIEDITINAGSNNPGAIALNFHNNNYGYVRRVTLLSEDGQGAIGLRLGQLNSGIGYVKDIRVQGFDYGIVNHGVTKPQDNEARGTLVICYVLEHIILSGQNIGGVLNRDKALSIRDLNSTNSVPAVIQQSARALAQERDNGLVVITDSTLRGGANGQPAINNIDGWLVAVRITANGYGTKVSDHGQSHSFSGEYVTGGVSTLLPDGVARDFPLITLKLPVQETPEVPQDPQSEWKVIDTTTLGPDGTAADDTDIIQEAINSGKTTVFLKRGAYTVSNTIMINNNVRRLNFNWSQFEIKNPLNGSSNPLFRFEDGTHPVVVFEAYTRRGFATAKAQFMHHNSSRTLVLRDVEAASFSEGIYRNSGTGKLFIEDVVSGAGSANPNELKPVVGWVFKNQEVWARHFNPEGSYPHIVNDGGKLWILGFKVGEGHGPYFRTINGGQTEALGGIFNNLALASEYPPNTAAIEIEDSVMSISGLETSRSDAPQQPHPVMVRETRVGVTRELLGAELPERADKKWLNAHALPLYRSPYPKPAPSSIEVTRSGFRYVQTTKRYVQTLTLTNRGSSTVGGPFSLVLTNLNSNAALYNRTGATSYTLPVGSPYIDIGAGGDGLAPNEARSVTLEFTKTGTQGITYSTRVLTGEGLR